MPLRKKSRGSKSPGATSSKKRNSIAPFQNMTHKRKLSDRSSLEMAKLLVSRGSSKHTSISPSVKTQKRNSFYNYKNARRSQPALLGKGGVQSGNLLQNMEKLVHLLESHSRKCPSFAKEFQKLNIGSSAVD